MCFMLVSISFLCRTSSLWMLFTLVIVATNLNLHHAHCTSYLTCIDIAGACIAIYTWKYIGIITLAQKGKYI